MRNLKKFLALVLAMMMVFGLMVTANAASVDDYTDGDEVNEDYRQAMEVITTLGVLQGDGTLLYPKGTLKRSELAAVLYRLYTGNNNVDKDEKTGLTPEDEDVILQFMKNADSYKDVPVGEWYTGYINYATDRGWLNGYGEYFGPNDTLTTIQMLKGVLCMLNVPLATTGDWQMNTLKAAQEINIIDDFTPAQLSGYATREMVAQIALNALDYKPDNDETGAYKIVLTAAGKAAYAVTGATIGTNRAFLALDGKVFETRAEAILNATLITQNTSGSGGNTTAQPGVHYDVVEEVKVNNTLGSKSFKLTKLTYGTGGQDAYGRPMTVYKKNGVVISQLPVDPIIERSKPITGAELYELGVNAAIELRQASAVDLTDYGYDAVRYTVKNNAIDRTPYGGNGVSVEIYKIATDSYVAVVLAPVFAQVTDIKSVRKTATEGAYTEYVLDIATTDSLKIYSSTVTKNDVTNVTINGTVDEDDYVIVTTEKEFDSKGNVVTSYVITPVKTTTGNITRYTSSSDSFTISGKSYPASAIPGSRATTSVMSAVGDGESHTIALDDNNNVVGVVDSTVVIPNGFIFALHDQKIVKINGNIGTDSHAVTGIDKNGNLITIEVNKIDNAAANDAKIDNSSNADVARGLYTAYKNSDGSYDLVYAKSAGNTKVYYTRSTAESGSNKTFTINGTSVLIANTLYTTANTKYYVATSTGSGATLKYTGVAVYTGYESIGNINALVGNKSKAIAAIDADGNGVAEVVFIDSYTTTFNDYAYVLDEYEVDEDGDYYYTAFVNGKWDKLWQANELTIALPALVKVTANVAALVSVNDSGSTTLTMNNSTFTYDSGLIVENLVTGGTSIFASNVRKDVPVYIFNGDEAKVTTAEKLKRDGGAVTVFVKDVTGIVAIYIVEDATGYGITNKTTMADIKTLPNGVYTPDNKSFATDLGSASATNLRIFKYTAHQKEKYTLNIYNANGVLVYEEKGSVERSKKGEAGVFYISLDPMGGNSGTRKGSGTLGWSGRSIAPAGNYTYEVVGQTSGLVVSSGSFTK